MPSQKLIKILKSKTLLSDEEIIPLSDAEAWDKVYEAEAMGHSQEVHLQNYSKFIPDGTSEMYDKANKAKL